MQHYIKKTEFLDQNWEITSRFQEKAGVLGAGLHLTCPRVFQCKAVVFGNLATMGL